MYRQQFLQIIDQVVSSINSRFDQPGMHLACCMESVLLQAAHGTVNKDNVKIMTDHFLDDFDCEKLHRQLAFLPDTVALSGKVNVETVNDLIDIFNSDQTGLTSR
jgi:hypothetical protein